MSARPHLYPCLSRSLLVLCLLTLCPAPADATQPAPAPPSNAQVLVARESFVAGRKHLKAGRYQEALASFRRADDIMALPSTRMGVADALNGLGKLIQAREAASSVAQMPKAPNENAALMAARRDALVLVKQLHERIPRLTLAFTEAIPKSTAITLDDKPIQIDRLQDVEVDPGRHTISVTAPGKAFEEVISIREGETRTVLLSLIDKSATQSSGVGPTLGPVAWSGIGITAAGLITGAVAGGITLSRSSDLSRRCTLGADGAGCPPDLHQARADSVTSAHVSTAGFALAGAGAVVTLIGLFVVDVEQDTPPPDEAQLRVRPLIGPGLIGIQGQF